MLASFDLHDPRVRRFAPVAALVVAALAAVVVPEKSHRLLSGTVEATGPVATATTTTLEPEQSRDRPGPTTAAVEPPAPILGAAPAMPTTRHQTASATPTTALAPLGPPTTLASTGPLRVVRHTWAQSATRLGTPLEAGPEGQLPVAALAGSDDRVSYVELDGDEPVLTLAVHDGGSMAPVAAIAACPIISAGWAPQDGQSFASAPEHDVERCVSGTPADDGSAWRFDLSAFPDRGSSVGFALVPEPGGAGTWQVTLSPGETG